MTADRDRLAALVARLKQAKASLLSDAVGFDGVGNDTERDACVDEAAAIDEAVERLLTAEDLVAAAVQPQLLTCEKCGGSRYYCKNCDCSECGNTRLLTAEAAPVKENQEEDLSRVDGQR